MDIFNCRGVEWDAVELPSQFMENWCYDRQTLYSFANHYQTGEPLPEDMFKRLKEAKTFRSGTMMLRQVRNMTVLTCAENNSLRNENLQTGS